MQQRGDLVQAGCDSLFGGEVEDLKSELRVADQSQMEKIETPL